MPITQKFLDAQSDVGGNTTQKDGRNFLTGMKRNGRAASIRMTKLFVRSFLTDFQETEMEKHQHDFAWFADREIAHFRLQERSEFR